jgi:hypothetical protein
MEPIPSVCVPWLMPTLKFYRIRFNVKKDCIISLNGDLILILTLTLFIKDKQT